MVAFTPTEEQQQLIDTIRRYAEQDIRKVAHEADESCEPPLGVIEKGWQLGLVPSSIPESMGGFGDGLNAITGALAAEELAFGELATAMHVLTPALFAYPLVLFGTDDQREALLNLFLDEAFAPATAALLEPGLSFDPHAMTTLATPDGDGVTLNGVKAYVPLADTASHILAYARSTESGQTEAYIVEKNADGVVIEKREKLMGIRALPMFRVRFDNVKLDSVAKLGGTDGIDFQVILNRQNVALGAMAVGVGRASCEYAVAYARERVQFGKPIAQNQAIAFMLAEVAIDVDAARLMVWEAAWKLDKGMDATREAYLAREVANKAVLFASDSGVQTLGGYGFIREYPAERWLRNGRGFPTFTGLAIV